MSTFLPFCISFSYFLKILIKKIYIIIIEQNLNIKFCNSSFEEEKKIDILPINLN